MIIGGIYYWKSQPKKITYTTETAKVGTIAKTVSATGEIVPETQADLSFKLSGRIDSMLVNVGDRVMAKQKIATVDKGTLLEELSRANNEIEVQKKTLSDMKDKDDTYSDDQIKAQKAQIKKAEDAVNIILTQIKATTLYSPLDGIVTKKIAELGENITVNSPVLTVSSLGEPYIQIDVPESDIVDVKIGQHAKITFDALSSDENLEGEIFEIEPASTVISDVVYYKAKIRLAKMDERLKIGMSADADINIFEKNSVVMIPYRAVKNDGDQDYVEILKAENVVEKINVKTGVKGDEGMVEIVSGLKGGEKVIVLSV
ncbi:MAG: Macrolide-specific efflux protein MacA [Candidatus Moranbacteria bacterium GW2011_GWF2_36_839]|nr:MAG: Macrolide-specific efflux protein MacA [Candidatus Moranbacteria bacterium GW2011_GWF1_36_78]KKQ17005.1 MAG: Macrolide-specific efflux protein MacA [Candidatus Moranbacteria bacterium GW2011_GWF2_36_839]